MLNAPSPFSKQLPKLQLAWDATSLSALMTCPRYYQLSIIDGWRNAEANEHLEFGGYYAKAIERFKKALVAGVSKEQATIDTLRATIEETWDVERGPWSGYYENTWHCEGSAPYRNAEGHHAKCPWSRVGVHVTGPRPETCGVCGSHTIAERRWFSAYGSKDRYGLIRAIAAYCDNAAAAEAEGPFPYAFPNGHPAVELSFQMPLPFKAGTGEPFLLAGHLDSIMTFGTEHFIADNKTTSKALNDKYWRSYTPNVQVDTYDLTGSVLWPQLDIKGVLIEGTQILKSGEVRLGIGPQYRTDEQREELLQELPYWFGQAEKFAREDYWPMNRRSCWNCPFASICAIPASKREIFLKSNFTKRHWNPLEER